ncbi:MAG: 16S rRNA (guanine(966)-N(2))-methyltransferase RsmD [Eubacterium sp.]|jgi:16S rRNA (guanine(966)-N(2))-methyltransferase RsmD|nr:16S rRNA (guanine(966)-N(2))-methyltransferase RsmD [Eubacterium sp.]
MRVITGSARGYKLKSPDGLDFRPTADAVKEAMFSAVQFEIEGRVVLDLFSGSGQLGVEALSRGAKKVVFVDNDKKSIDITGYNVEKTGSSNKAEIFYQPNMTFLKNTSEVFDLAFLDPPYELKLIQKTLPLLTEKMSEIGVIVCEHEKGLKLPEHENGFSIYKTYKKGKTEITIYRRTEINEDGDISGQL